MVNRIAAVVAATTIAVALSGCGNVSAKTYDISPIFPLSAGKCAQYNGDQKGSGITATCMVTKTECKKAAADWRKAMEGAASTMRSSSVATESNKGHFGIERGIATREVSANA